MFDRKALEPAITARGREFFESIRGESPSIFNKGWWTGKVMDWSMANEDFKVQLFRFVDVLPYINTSESLTRHIDEYFCCDEVELPAVFKIGAAGLGKGGKIAATLVSRTIRSNIEKMGRQFIIGEESREAVKNINKLRKDGFGAVIDLLGEATVSENEARAYKQGYLDLLDGIEEALPKWSGLESGGDLDWAHAPMLNIAVKPSAFYSQAKPVDLEGSVEVIYRRIAAILRRVIELKGFLCIDMEQRRYKDITIELYKRLRSSPEFRDYPHLGIVLQSYLRETDDDLENLLEWARAEDLPISIRLVKGAYWDYETVIAKQNGLPVPVYTIKAESDAAYERQAARILQNHEICHFACASHNVRTIAAVMEVANALEVPEDRYEFQVLYGMGEPVRKGLLKVAKRVRLYCPYGELIPGMAYLVRRLLENTANESFLRQGFAEEVDIEHLLEDPQDTVARERALRDAAKESRRPRRRNGLARFENEPVADFTLPEERQAFADAIAAVRQQLGKTYPLLIGDEDVTTDDTVVSVNPANPDEIVGRVCQAGKPEIDMAMEAAKGALMQWRHTPPRERAEYILKAASIARAKIHELSAWQILEVGKQWDQAHGDVGEAIDFMEYYAREMIRLGTPRRMGQAPGEMDLLSYESMGIAAVIAPWNFPYAISCGMTAAAMVTGNCVLYKPANLSPVIGYTLAETFREAGIPDGVFNFVPGRGSVIGDYIVEHPDISLICFTGSMDVGLRIQQKAAVVQPGQNHCKRVVCEMGGKNAIIIDDDADLDEAVSQVVYSAFGFQGQKCSACSRVIVVDPIYDRFIERLSEAARSIKIGPAEDPANYMGPVVDANQQATVNKYIEIGKAEGRLLLSREVPDSKGYYAPLTIIENITPEHRLAQEEIFGPVLAVMRAKDFKEAVDMGNSTRFALTGGVFSRSPAHIEYAKQYFRVGNLYINRGCTGALVERHPFGGFNMSGIGSKTGSPDYLIQFMYPRAICENTMRRGFAPIEEGDDWID